MGKYLFNAYLSQMMPWKQRPKIARPYCITNTILQCVNCFFNQLTSTHTGHTKCVKYLLERGAQVNGSASDSLAAETPLHVAAAAGNIRIIELLMAFGASPFSAAMRNDTTSAMTTTTGTLSAVASELPLIKYRVSKSSCNF